MPVLKRDQQALEGSQQAEAEDDGIDGDDGLGEFAQRAEWNHDKSLDWHLAGEFKHTALQRWVRRLNEFYRSEKALYEDDFTEKGFVWNDRSDRDQSVISFTRRGGDSRDDLLVICNFTPVVHHDYRVGVWENGSWREVLNSDALEFGGSDVVNSKSLTTEPVGAAGKDFSIRLILPPLGILFLKKEPA